jgi:hypothetical protein
MSSLIASVKELESDLLKVPPKIAVYSDLPFAIMRYDSSEEWALRREVRLLATRLEAAGKHVEIISFSELLWTALDRVQKADDQEGLDAIVELERNDSFMKAQGQITTYLSDPDFCPLADLLAERLSSLDPAKSIALLIRAAVMSPKLYEMSKLLDDMQGKSKVTTILFYPGSREGVTALRFMELKEREALGNYRVKIYG